MKKFVWVLISLVLFASTVLAEDLVPGNAYIISSINVKPSEVIESGKEYSLVPQVVLYETGKEYVGSVTKFSGCYNGNMYDQSVKVGACLTGVVDSLGSSSTTDALSANQGRILNSKITNIENSYVAQGNNIYWHTSGIYPNATPGLVFSGSTDMYKIYMEERASDITSLVIEIADNQNDFVEIRMVPCDGSGTKTVMTVDGYGNVNITGHLYVNGTLVK